MLIDPLNFELAQCDEQIQLISDLAYELFPVYYKPFVKVQHYTYYLDTYQSVAAIKSQIENRSQYYLVYSNNEVLGYLGVAYDKNECFLSKIYLKENYLGQGIGGAIMAWLNKKAIAENCKTIGLNVLIQNEKAIRFYLKHGFVKEETFEYTFFTGYAETNLKMSKSINN